MNAVLSIQESIAEIRRSSQVPRTLIYLAFVAAFVLYQQTGTRESAVDKTDMSEQTVSNFQFYYSKLIAWLKIEKSSISK